MPEFFLESAPIPSQIDFACSLGYNYLIFTLIITMRQLLRPNHLLLFSLILILGVLPRLWNFGAFPADLHQDEVGNGIDAYYLSEYGYDRTGISYPVHFISWGDGSSALYAYAALPFVKVLGLTPLSIRLPNLLAGILLLPIAFLIGRKLKHTSFGLIVMFLVAISPWTFMGSRYALEPYFVPFLFSIGFLLLLYSEKSSLYFPASMLFFSLCLYTYSTSFSVVPLFLVVVFITKAVTKSIPRRTLLIGLITFLIVSLPILLYVVVNTFKLESIQIWRMTIPRLPIEARYQTLVAIFQQNALGELAANFWIMLKLLWTQTDGWYRNAIPPFGYLYPLAPVLAVIGIGLIIRQKRLKENSWLFLIVWLTSCLSIGILQSTNFNRMALIYLPITFCVAYFWDWIATQRRIFLLPGALLYLCVFVWFCVSYFSTWYQAKVDHDFNRGLLDAIRSTENSDTPVCFSDNINTAYMYVLYLNKPDPKDFLRTIGKINSGNPFQDGHPLRRYQFGANRCEEPDHSILIHRNTEEWTGSQADRIVNHFGVFVVEIP